MRNKAFWQNLTKNERSELMFYQMASDKSSSGTGWNLPEGYADCCACGAIPTMMGWFCDACYKRWKELMNKAQGLAKKGG